ncbi:MAG: NAD-dependent epimerase/dehydratase family protein [Pseudomonadota bacterium]|nr:NAD-dependent epimerase/dehydratase family protein [Pseudomonadota bacterium]
MDRIIAVTGATGFIGAHLCRALSQAGYAVRALVRSAPQHPLPGTEYFPLGELERAGEAALDHALRNISAVVHLAGRAHVLDERSRNPRAAYEAANVDTTTRVLAASLRCGVSRFVLASSVKVNGESTYAGQPFRPHDAPAPKDAYGQTKLAAEQLLSSRQDAPCTAVVLRLPLVYGPGVRGNFERLMEAIASERWLPIGAIDNRRSLAYVGNVCDAIEAVLGNPTAMCGVHFVADEAPVSTPQLAREIAAALHVRARIVRVPVPLLQVAAAVAGRSPQVSRLVSSLEVDTTSLRAAARWRPPYTLQQGLEATAAWWRLRHSI